MLTWPFWWFYLCRQHHGGCTLRVLTEPAAKSVKINDFPEKSWFLVTIIDSERLFTGWRGANFLEMQNLLTANLPRGCFPIVYPGRMSQAEALEDWTPQYLQIRSLLPPGRAKLPWIPGPLADRCDTHPQGGVFWRPARRRLAVPSYQRRPSSPRKREGNVRFLHGVRRSARPTSRWASKAHCMMGKTQ